MHALLVTIASAGGVHPFIAVGRALVSRGRRATVLANRKFEASRTVRRSRSGLER